MGQLEENPGLSTKALYAPFSNPVLRRPLESPSQHAEERPPGSIRQIPTGQRRTAGPTNSWPQGQQQQAGTGSGPSCPAEAMGPIETQRYPIGAVMEPWLSHCRSRAHMDGINPGREAGRLPASSAAALSLPCAWWRALGDVLLTARTSCPCRGSKNLFHPPTYSAPERRKHLVVWRFEPVPGRSVLEWKGCGPFTSIWGLGTPADQASSLATSPRPTSGSAALAVLDSRPSYIQPAMDPAAGGGWVKRGALMAA